MALEEVRIAGPKRSNAALKKAKEALISLKDKTKQQLSNLRKNAGLNDKWLVQVAGGSAGVVMIDYLFGATIKKAFGKWAQYAIPAVAGAGGFALFKWGKSPTMKGVGLGLVAGAVFVLAKQLLLPDAAAVAPITGVGYGGSMAAPSSMLALKVPDYYSPVNDYYVDGIQDVNGVQDQD
ncbi:MAG: hypothetical protein WC477_07390 [Patescibacteria group bacterium]